MKTAIDKIRNKRREYQAFINMCHKLHNNGPHWIERWQEYAALDAQDVIHYGETAHDAYEKMKEANERIARWWKECHRADGVWRPIIPRDCSTIQTEEMK